MGIPWTDEQVTTLCRLHALGESFSKIGDAVGKTRNSVATKVGRLGLPRRQANETQKQVAILRLRKTRKSRPRARVEPVKPVEPVAMERVSFLDLKTGQCKYPLWQSHESSGDCCGNEAVPGQPYCSYHMHVTHIPDPETKANASG